MDISILLVTQCTIVLTRKKYRVNKIHMNFIDPIFSVLGQLYTV